MVVGPQRERLRVLLALRWVSLACKEGGGLRKLEEPAAVRAYGHPRAQGGSSVTLLPPVSCLIVSDQR